MMQDIEDEFAFLDDWEDRYTHLIELGKAMPKLCDADKTDANQIQGCVSKVWLVVNKDQQGKFTFKGDSDAAIVRGLVAVLLRMVNDKTATQITSIDPAAIFARIGLADNLSPQRANGLNSMIEYINKTIAA
ncbi:MAG: SufE family protein [Robiginitomaculum sp.]|nr:SufE family protein [Robiginitomaculum sp.]